MNHPGAVPDVSTAIDRLTSFFESAPTRQGVLARETLGRTTPDDAELRERLIAGMRAELRTDGSISGGAVPTIWRAHELMDLGHGGQQPGTVRVMRWILSLQGQPGAFGEGCSPERHGQRVCEHFVAGFFSPGLPEQRLAPITLPNGKVFRVEPTARFTASCLALRAVLRAQPDYERYPLVEHHLASLVRLSERWTSWSGYFAPDMIVAGMHALALSRAPYRDAVSALVALIGANQSDDGTWSNADLFHLFEALLATGTPEAQAIIRRAAPALAARQRPDGTFGAMAQQERALIVLRALVWSR
jgi:hypothetical protein